MKQYLSDAFKGLLALIILILSAKAYNTFYVARLHYHSAREKLDEGMMSQAGNIHPFI